MFHNTRTSVRVVSIGSRPQLCINPFIIQRSPFMQTEDKRERESVTVRAQVINDGCLDLQVRGSLSLNRSHSLIFTAVSSSLLACSLLYFLSLPPFVAFPSLTPSPYLDLRLHVGWCVLVRVSIVCVSHTRIKVASRETKRGGMRRKRKRKKRAHRGAALSFSNGKTTGVCERERVCLCAQRE